MSTKLKKSDNEIFYPAGKKVVIGGKEMFVKPFVLKTRSVVVKIFADIFFEAAKNNSDLSKGVNLSTGDIVRAVIVVAGDKVKDIYSIVFPEVDYEWLQDNMTLKNEVEVWTAIIEVNDIPFLISQVEAIVGQVKK